MNEALIVLISDDYGTKSYGPFESYKEIHDWCESAFMNEKGWESNETTIWVTRTNPYTHEDEQVEIGEIVKINKEKPTYTIRDGH